MSRSDDQKFQDFVLLAEAAYQVEVRLNPNRIPWRNGSKPDPRRSASRESRPVVLGICRIQDHLDAMFVELGWQAMWHDRGEHDYSRIVKPGANGVHSDVANDLDQAAQNLKRLAVRPVIPPSRPATSLDIFPPLLRKNWPTSQQTWRPKFGC